MYLLVEIQQITKLYPIANKIMPQRGFKRFK